MQKPSLEDVIILATQSHKGQRDRADLPYILHPLRVMMEMDPADEDAMIVAVLHDVVEDTSVTLSDLQSKGYPDNIVDALDCLTKRTNPAEAGSGVYDINGKERYSYYIRRIKQNPLATKVKIADLRHNSDLGRLRKVESWDLKRLDRYQRALMYLTNRYGSPDILVD
ncbi:bifunctional (p)ppGpp synthetase/guanosine-3',5'-bis(diphosphate) 3'-pyrophosphohydrolase [Methanocella arvoryzae]|uniref:Uncharacterized protein n=1 Tax=Methanocella arvoryzae (strain DSM 22066 / NBRC 105507 / MRE50) TaxID=351160 RepID=Q0W5B9_METAR|nr:conserved hypothetical protein [Methanocella arvoryzae MRE50]